MKTEKLGGVAGGEGECGDDVAWWLVRERRSLDILPVKKEAKLSARGVAHLVVHGTSGSISYETIPPVRLETSGGVRTYSRLLFQTG